ERERQLGAEVGYEHFDGCRRRSCSYRLDAGDKVRRAAVAQIVAIDRRNDDEFEPHLRDRARQIVRLIVIERLRFPVRHIAEWTAPGAEPTHDHESRRAVCETFADVRAGRLFAYRVEPMRA